ncbi:hypothetical protein Tco_1334344 [Tanacetum coccineum]
MIGWLEEKYSVNEGVNNEDIKDEDVEIELDNDAELIFPYEVEGDKTPPTGGVSSNSEPPNAEPPNTESSDSVSSDSELEDEEADVAPEDTFGTITQRPYIVRDFPRGTDNSQKDEKPSKKQQNRTRDGKVCENEAQSKSSQLREEKAEKNIT